MLVFSDLTLRRGAKALLESTTFAIHPGQKVGLTGANGVGKSTLFSLIRGELSQDTGNFSIPPAWVIAHVQQETPASEQSALEYALEGDSEYVSLRQQLDRYRAAARSATHPGAATTGIDQPSATAIDLLAKLLERHTEELVEVGGYADQLRAVGETCEAAYDATHRALNDAQTR